MNRFLWFRRIRERLLGQQNNVNRVETSMMSLQDQEEINVVGVEMRLGEMRLGKKGRTD